MKRRPGGFCSTDYRAAPSVRVTGSARCAPMCARRVARARPAPTGPRRRSGQLARGACARPGQAIRRLHFPTEQTGECRTRVAERIDALTPPDGNDGGDAPREAPPRGAATDRETARALHGMIGVGLTLIPTVGVASAPDIAPKIGPDFSAFPSGRHFRSWPGLALGTRFGGGRTVPGRTPEVVNRVGQVPRMAAMTAGGSPAPRAPRPQGRVCRGQHHRARARGSGLHHGNPGRGVCGVRDGGLGRAPRQTGSVKSGTAAW